MTNHRSAAFWTTLRDLRPQGSKAVATGGFARRFRQGFLHNPVTGDVNRRQSQCKTRARLRGCGVWEVPGQFEKGAALASGMRGDWRPAVAALILYAVVLPQSWGGSSWSDPTTVDTRWLEITSQPQSQSAWAQTVVTLSVVAAGMEPFSYQWQFNNVDIPNATNAALTIPSVQASDLGAYRVIVSNAGGSTNSAPAWLTGRLNPELNTTNWAWSSGVGALWYAQSTTTHDGLTAARSGAVGNSASSWLTTVLTGPGKLTFWWKVSSQTNADHLRLEVNGTEALRLSGEVDWRQETIYLAAGSNSVTWEYAKDAAGSAGQDAGWLDQVGFTPGATPATINQQPASRGVLAGENATFYASAFGTPPLSLQWQLEGTSLPGATGATLALTNVQSRDGGSYQLVVSNTYATVTSSNAVLLVTNRLPFITSQPVSQTVWPGESAAFMVVAVGTEPMRFQWQVNRANLPADTNTSLMISNVQAANLGNYRVVVSNAMGAVTSAVAVLTVFQPGIFDDFEPGIDLTQWSAFGGVVGSTVLATNYGGSVSGVNSLWFGNAGSRFATTIPVDTTAGGKVSFWLRIAAGISSPWEKADLPGEGIVLEYSVTGGTVWTNIGTYDTAAYTNWTLVQMPIPAGAQSSSTYFRWRQLANSGAVSDHWALDDITVSTGPQPPFITAQPASQTVGVGATVNFSVPAAGTAPLSYQWRKGGADLSGATNAAYAISNAQTNDAGSYSVVVTNAYGSVTSSNATLNVSQLPVFATQPLTQTVRVGSNVTFNVTAYGAPPLVFQWYFKGTPVGSPDSGTNFSSYTLTNVGTNQAGNYTVQVVNGFGSVTSSNAVLTVNVFPPSIGIQPSSQRVMIGSNVSFTVSVSGTAPFSYQWRFQGTNLLHATNADYVIPAVASTNTGNYSVIVTNPAGSVTSSNALLTVIIPPALALQLLAGYPLLNLDGMLGSNFVVQYNTNLAESNWLNLLALTNLSASPYQFLDPAGSSQPARFYRAFMQ